MKMCYYDGWSSEYLFPSLDQNLGADWSKSRGPVCKGVSDQSFSVPFDAKYLSRSQFLEIPRSPSHQQHPSDFVIEFNRRIKTVSLSLHIERVDSDYKSARWIYCPRVGTYFDLLIPTQKLTDVSDIANSLDCSQMRVEFCFLSVLQVLISSFAPRTNKVAKLVFVISAGAAGIFLKTAYDSHWLFKRKEENRELAREQLRSEID